ncbi:hypothetical protein FEM03_08255 [Phragmitibacter flavus]|uniref:Uncharacterized protein n=1 Tax=Phragmitibacter flavus TaxID=2576071 RepID=A0A5R8KGS5_9BACT|nr:hypothetical protein [Phragmitibacter flavus]TLD71506.1 hypothetical protein FEM03_08255 [Phragmitibacter flavus]
MKTIVPTLCTAALLLSVASCSYHEEVKPAPTVTTQSTTEVVRPAVTTSYPVPAASSTTVRETRTY